MTQKDLYLWANPATPYTPMDKLNYSEGSTPMDKPNHTERSTPVDKPNHTGGSTPMDKLNYTIWRRIYTHR